VKARDRRAIRRIVESVLRDEIGVVAELLSSVSLPSRTLARHYPTPRSRRLLRLALRVGLRGAETPPEPMRAVWFHHDR